MSYSYNSKLTANAKMLRKNMTKEERHLWYDYLRDYKLHFYKQRIIGNYIVDFYCPAAKLIIELDGGQHYNDAAIKKDAERTSFLESLGNTVIRIPNSEVNQNFTGVCDYIDSVIEVHIQRRP